MLGARSIDEQKGNRRHRGSEQQAWLTSLGRASWKTFDTIFIVYRKELLPPVINYTEEEVHPSFLIFSMKRSLSYSLSIYLSPFFLSSWNTIVTFNRATRDQQLTLDVNWSRRTRIISAPVSKLIFLRSYRKLIPLLFSLRFSSFLFSSSFLSKSPRWKFYEDKNQ